MRLDNGEIKKRIGVAVEGNATVLDLSYPEPWDGRNIFGDAKFPDSIEELKQLNKLSLAGNHLTELPVFIRELKQLEALDLGNNNLTVLPEWVGELKHLKFIDLTNNQFTTSPDCLGNLDQLEVLHLHVGKLASPPEFIGRLKQLKALLLYHAKFETVPEFITGLTKLELLRLQSVQLAMLPKSITELRQLKVLQLSHNQLTTLPKFINELSELKTLGLCGNLLTELPESITELERLYELDIMDNNFTSVPGIIGELRQLTGLFLRHINLAVLPQFITELNNLKVLYLSEMQLKSLPEPIVNLMQLQRLNLRHNKFTSLPESITEISSLQELDFIENLLTSLPDSISKLKQLKILRLNSNKFVELPRVICDLHSLQELSLGGNLLKKLPDSIGDLHQLHMLLLRANQLTELPKSIAGLKKLKFLYLEGNPLEVPPKEIIERGLQAVLDYFQQIDEQSSDRLYECKLLIVGDPSAGKTTLLRKLLNPAYQVPNKDNVSTVGVDIDTWYFESTNAENVPIQIRVNLWDFGGQTIQYLTHQFFLSSRSFYVLVSDDRSQRTNFDYWLNLIDMMGGESPILILLNEINHRPIGGINLANYQAQYPSLIREVRDIDFSKDDGRYETLIDHLKGHLRSLGHIGDPLPKQWIPVRKRLEGLQRKRNYITRKEYTDLCCEYGIEVERHQLSLSQYLHDLGVIYHFSNDSAIARWVILNPQWVVNAVYTILADKTVYENGGRFDKEWLFSRWVDYDLDEKDYLLSLMLKNRFDICYATDKSNKNYLVPQLLPQDQPKYQFEQDDCLRVRYRYKFMPYGLISRLIVRLSEDIDQENGVPINWKSGVMFKNCDVRALVEHKTSEEGQQVIDIQVSGKMGHRKDYLSHIRKTIESIHSDSYKQIKYDEMIPCNHCIATGETPPNYFPNSHLITLIERGKSSNTCGICGEEYSPIELVYGVYDSQELDKKSIIINKFEGKLIFNDNYDIQGQAAAVGPQAHAHDINFNQIWQQSKTGIDLKELLGQLGTLRERLAAEATEARHYVDIGSIASAEEAAKADDGAKALECLSKVGKWGLGVAEKIGVPVVIAAIKSAMGIVP